MVLNKILKTNTPGIFIRSKKMIKYETIDFSFKPNKLYKLTKIIKTKYTVPNVPYDEQYEYRDFKRK
jgi:hypothetical protein